MSITFLRAQTPSDFDQFFELVEQYRLELNESVCFPSYAQERANYAQDDTFIFLARDQEKAVGCIAYRPVKRVTSSQIYELKRMYVTPPNRQKNLAEKLLHFTFDHLREQGIEKIELESLSKLTPALRFYEKHGFRLDEEARHTDHEDIVPMGLTL